MGENAICTKQTKEDGGKKQKRENSPQRDFPTLLVLRRLLWRWKENWKSIHKYKKPNEWVLVLKG